MPKEDPLEHERVHIPTQPQVNDFFDMDAFLMEENWNELENWIATRKSKEKREHEELEATKVEMRTKNHQEQASTSVVPLVAI